MSIIVEKVLKTEAGYMRLRFSEDGGYEEIQITEREYLETARKQTEAEPDRLRESDKFSSPIGFHEDGRKITDEEVEKVRQWLYPT